MTEQERGRLHWLIERAAQQIVIDEDTAKALTDPVVWPRLVDEGPAQLAMALQTEVAGLINIFIPSPGQSVDCELNHNPESVSTGKATQCGACGRWYCRKHKMHNCPACGAKLP